MSAADPHRAAAVTALSMLGAATEDIGGVSVSTEASAHALLAIEARLGEMAHAQETANLIGAYATGVFDSGIEEGLRKTIRARITDIIQRGSMARANGSEAL